MIQLPLSEIISTTRFSPAERAENANRILSATLASSSTIRAGNFNRISDSDLANLFSLIDTGYFSGKVAECLKNGNHSLRFRVSRRMTSSGGVTTTRFPISGNGPKQFEIAISSTLLFESFRDGKTINVTGLICQDRFQALQRIMEHEMVHLIEMLLWNDSSCTAQRFRQIAGRFFGHQQSTHQLITPTDTAQTKYDVEIGDRVSFIYKKTRLVGFVNRITRRATILVPALSGLAYTDGRRYRKYYVPVDRLSKTKSTEHRSATNCAIS